MLQAYSSMVSMDFPGYLINHDLVRDFVLYEYVRIYTRTRTSAECVSAYIVKNT